jgi:hypothetical protein
MTLSRFSLDANHFWIAVIIFLVSIAILITGKAGEKASGLETAVRKLGGIFMITGVFSGILVLLKLAGLSVLTRLAYTTFDVSLALLALTSVVSLFLSMISVRAE